MTLPSSFVVVTQAAPVDYLTDYVALPRNYGTQRYFQREDVRAIFDAVAANLAELDTKAGFTSQLKDRRVILKPNLVTVFHHLGTIAPDYPETTDPRVLDAVIAWLQRYTRDIVIAESSGRGFPTRAAFKITGIDRLAAYRKVRLVVLEEQPVDRYLLPGAKVMREIALPRIFSQVVRRDAFYISLPKLKTNLYTGVTLGFKNAMGCIPYNLRQRNHTHDIDQKLVDMLHLFKPDLVIIDGIVGGEGNCPAPVEPVQSRVLISGNHPVETDRIATRLMGIDPEKIRLLRIADKDGFTDPRVQVIGSTAGVPFRQADPSLFGHWMAENFPRVRVLIGHAMPHSPLPGKDGSFTIPQLTELENSCRGGCLATTRYAFDMIYYEGLRRDFELTLIFGAGVNTSTGPVWFDRTGGAWMQESIALLGGKQIAIGTCAACFKGTADRYVDGCMPYPNCPHQAIHLLTGVPCRVMSFRNRQLVSMLLATLRTGWARKQLIRGGERVDVPLMHADKVYPIRQLSDAELKMNFIYEPFPGLTKSEIGQLCRAEDRALLATFNP